MARGYRALKERTSGLARASVLHLVRDDAEASLCGIPESALGPGSVTDQRVCSECIEWLPKRQAFSGKFARPTKT
jgi:hypothetical protein